MTQELVDYSSTANADWNALAQSLKAAGKVGVGRYAVNDKSPNGRGISAAEYQAMTAAGLDTFIYWESSEGWMLDGFQAGVFAAQNAALNLRVAGMPATTPVYFACDIDATPEDQAAIDDCLRGAASILGAGRVGIYGGYHVVKRCMQNKTAAYFCQTSAWSGGLILGGIHLYQYDYNEYFAGTNCDLVRAYQPNYGQAVPVVIEVEPPVPTYVTPLPIPFKTGDTGWHELNGSNVYALVAEVQAKRDNVVCRAWAESDAPKSARNLRNGEKRIAIGSMLIPRKKKGTTVSERWLILDDKSRVRGSAMTPILPVKP